MPDRSVLTLGNFDGPHVGHLAILERARTLAQHHAARVVAITFDPPPIQVLRPGSEPPRLVSLEKRIERLRDGGADEINVIIPTADMLAQTPAEFIGHLVDRYRPVAIVEGTDFRFGRGRAGDMDTLAELGEIHGFEAVVVPRVAATLGDQQAAPVSSSLVRWLIGRGRVADAAACLGRPFCLTAAVARGEQRGRQLGVPTANLDADQIAPYIVPADGVYAGLATLASTNSPSHASNLKPQPSTIPAAISVGVKPTFGKKTLTVEAHLLDFDNDLYGQTLTLHFARWVRDQYPFPGVDALREQLGRDIQQVRAWHRAGVLHQFPFNPMVKA